MIQPVINNWPKILVLSKLRNLAIEEIDIDTMDIVNIAIDNIDVDIDADRHGFRQRRYIYLHLGICSGSSEQTKSTF